MENYLEIDLREILKKIIKKWYWVILSGFVIGLGVFLFSFFQPDIYRVTTQFILTEPLYDVNFEAQYKTKELDKPSEDIVKTIVLNDEIVSELRDLWQTDQKDETTLLQFKEDHLSVTFGEKGVLVSLVVETDSREQSALLANTWVDLAIAAVNNKYYGFETDQVGTLGKQMTESQAEVDAASQRLIDFSNRDPSKILQNNLDNLLADQRENNYAVRMINSARNDAQAIVDLLKKQPSTSAVDSGTRLSFTLIQAKALNASTSTGTPFDLFLDISNQGDDITAGELIILIENWSSVMADRIVAL